MPANNYADTVYEDQVPNSRAHISYHTSVDCTNKHKFFPHLQGGA